MRTKAFIPNEALRSAMLRFWERGFEATSMQDLQTVMGIKRQSIYDTFGTKHELFISSLKYYFEHVIATNLAPLFTQASPKQAIKSYFYQRVKDIDDPYVIDGCFLTNSVAELGIWNEEVQTQVKKMLEYMENAFKSAIQRAQKLGEIDEHKDSKILATLLLNNAQGLFVLAKSGMSRQKLRKLTNQFLKVLD